MAEGIVASLTLSPGCVLEILGGGLLGYELVSAWDWVCFRCYVWCIVYGVDCSIRKRGDLDDARPSRAEA